MDGPRARLQLQNVRSSLENALNTELSRSDRNAQVSMALMYLRHAEQFLVPSAEEPREVEA